MIRTMTAMAQRAPRAAAVVALAWLYCGLLVSTVVALRLRFGFGWVILVFVVTWANDTLAFFAGKLRGGEIAPHVSLCRILRHAFAFP